MKKAKVYISGAMSNVPRETYLAAFREAEQQLRAKGYNRIVNPIRVWACRWPWLYRAMEWVIGKEPAYCVVLLYDLWLLMRCTHIFMLQGWTTSRGACIEHGVAANFRIQFVELHSRSEYDRLPDSIKKNVDFDILEWLRCKALKKNKSKEL